MEDVFYIIFFLSCVVLVGAVLLQPGKSNAGALFTSNISSNAFAPRGTQTILSKITIIAASVFMVSALVLAGLSEPASLFDEGAEEAKKATTKSEKKPAEQAKPPVTPQQGIPTGK